MADFELLTFNLAKMTIESTNDNIPTTPAITYSECYAQVFSRLFFGDCLIESNKIETGSVDLILTDYLKLHSCRLHKYLTVMCNATDHHSNELLLFQ